MGKYLFNAHSHIFDFKCVPNHMSDKWYLKWIGINKIVTSKFSRVLAGKYSALAGENKISRVLNFVAIGMNSTQEEIFNILQKNYANLGDARFVVLPMDMEYMGGGPIGKPYRQQLYDLMRLRVQYPDKMIPFLGIHPDRFKDRNETLRFVQEYIGKGKAFAGIKLYPATGYYPDDERLADMYAFAEEHGLPITTHCTHGPTHYLGKPPALNKRNIDNRKFFHPLYYRMDGDTIVPNELFVHSRKPGDFQDNWTNPYIFRETVLKKHPRLKVNFAHFGGAGRMAQYHKGGCTDTNNWYGIIRRMLEDEVHYPNVYADISYTLTKKSVAGLLAADINDERINRRILFGTDYYVVSVEQYEEAIKTGFFAELNDIVMLTKIAHDNVNTFLTSSFFKPA